MTHNTLFLQRLRIVTDTGAVAYDELFHRGVNIIRGKNSSGKSTIVRFIFFVLGGYYTDFVPQALKCRYVMAEVCINGTVVTLKRYLEKKEDGKVNGYAPMYVYFGPMSEVVTRFKVQGSSDERPETWNLKPETWSKFPYVTTDKTRSFSNVLFEMLGYPEVKADSNITMHQILRLIYLDQESPVNSLFFYEPFDKEIYRETVANLLLGLYDQKYSDAKQELQNVVKSIAEVKVSIKNVSEFLKGMDVKSSAYIRQEIESRNDEIAWISAQIQALRGVESQDEKREPKVKLEYQRIQEDITKQRKVSDVLEREVKELEHEIEDTGYFIEALNRRLDALNKSIATRDYFDSLHLDFCPECLTRIDHEAEEGHCPLCKSPIDNTKGKSQAMRIRLEIQFQLRESKALKEESEHLLEEKKAKLRRIKRQLTASQRHYDDAVNYVRSTHEEQIDKLLQDKGFKEGEILQYRTLQEQAEKYESLLDELETLKRRESELNRYIEVTENRIRLERKSIDAAVSECGLYLLRNDEQRQAEFMQARDFVIDYSQNMTYISNQRIKLSASSAFYLKMVARFALLFASLKVDSMMYPRLLFSDNMEDKGLEQGRAEKFQRTVVRLLKEMEMEERKMLETRNLKPETGASALNYQLIFATSMIAPELDTKEYVIGDYYNEENKSLKNV